jgi:hypothetical protein
MMKPPGLNGSFFTLRFWRAFLFVWASTTTANFRESSHQGLITFVVLALTCSVNGLFWGLIVSGIWTGIARLVKFQASRQTASPKITIACFVVGIIFGFIFAANK